MAVVYCTAADVARICNITSSINDRAVFGTDPLVPSQAEVESMIEEAEADIEDLIKQAFGTKFITITAEMHNVFPDYQETSIHLGKTDVATFDTAEGDLLEVWDGNNWVDWITTYTEGRGDDFFVDYSLGKIFFRNRRPCYSKQSVRVTYRQNSGSTVPKSIKVATALTVGIQLTNSEFASVLFPEGETENTNANTRISNWQKQIDKKLKPYEVYELDGDSGFIPTY